jgi:hypothetical protein
MTTTRNRNEEPPLGKIELEYAFSIRIDFKERLQFKTPAGKRSYVPATGGEIWGPRLQGRVVAGSGADFAGVYGLDAHYMLEAADGSPIYIHNTGFIRALNGEPTKVDDPSWGGDREYYFRITPRFDTPVGPHDWLTRTIIIGTGQRVANPDHTVFTYYAVK